MRFNDLPGSVRQRLAVSEEEFPEYIRSIARATDRRERDGEFDHLIYFLLQSAKFTNRARIEPALSAREFAGTGKIPGPVLSRMKDFLQAPRADERLAYFRSLLAQSNEPPIDRLGREYVRAMRFLYQKEFQAAGAPVYRSRGHSTDTQIESNFAVHAGISVIRELDPRTHLNHVLVVGPGLDFAPRTDLVEAFEPQSYQPFAVADALIEVGLAEANQLRVDCVDINDRVIRFLREFSNRREPRLWIYSGLTDDASHSLTPEFKKYFRELGSGIGVEGPLDAPGHRLAKSLVVRREIAERVAAAKLNILTERYDPSPEYDLVLATNVFLYFDPHELLLALTNIRSMLRVGGYLIHNELRAELEADTRLLGMPPIHARTVLIAPGKDKGLYDSVVIHKK